MKGHDHGRVHLTDMIIGTTVFVAIVYLVPVINALTVDVEFDPVTEMLLGLAGPFLFILLIIAFGVSAVRRD